MSDTERQTTEEVMPAVYLEAPVAVTPMGLYTGASINVLYHWGDKGQEVRGVSRKYGYFKISIR